MKYLLLTILALWVVEGNTATITCYMSGYTYQTYSGKITGTVSSGFYEVTNDQHTYYLPVNACIVEK
jgi:hypothetical protein